MTISLVVDNPQSWFIPFAEILNERLKSLGSPELFNSFNRIPAANEIAFFLSCEKKVSPSILQRSRHNIVVHASNLPEGKGMSPLSWQILEGKNKVPISLFEAIEEFDAGNIYLKDSIRFEGNELLPEMRNVLGKKIVEMCERFVREYPAVITQALPQSGPESFYRRRKPEDSRLDPNKTIAEQFNLLRVVDNERYPAFFELRGRKFVIKVHSGSLRK